MSEAPPIAIVGMAGRFPGAADIDRLWELLLARGDAITPVPEDRWDAAAPLDDTRRVQAVGGFLPEIDRFDAALFGISPREAADIDPQQRVVLETVWRTLEDGGAEPTTLRGRRIGVYMGASWHDFEIVRKERGAPPTPHSLVGSALDVIAARVSYTLGLTGPSMTVETGCSSALVALDLAVRAIRTGDIEAAVVGGVNLLLAPDVSIGLTHFGGLSENGRCAAFGADADGFVRGEGVAAVYLKALPAARADGDRVRAVVLGTMVNNDGGGDSLVTPSRDGQRDLLHRAYRSCGIDPGAVDYVEAHGTGTRRGDPVEAGALGAILGSARSPERGPLPIGSIKTNIGHLEAAAGIAGLVKAVLCVQHRRIPPTLHADDPNPDIPFADHNLTVVREPVELPAERPCTVGVNSFGWGGTNAHVVIRSADKPAEPAPAPRPRHPAVLALSAHTETALRQRCRDVAERLTAEPADAAALVTALAHRSTGHPVRLAVVGAGIEEQVAALRDYADSSSEPTPSVCTGRARRPGRIAFAFPGQGGQWHGLAAALYGTDAAFTEAIDRCADALAPHVDGQVRAALTGAAGPDWLERVDLLQPVLWAQACAIAAMWRRVGVVPDVVIGHSQGEIAAATVAGLISVRDGARVVARRSAALRTVAGTGRMLAVDLSPADALAEITGFEDLVTVAVHNGPRSCVLSGDADAIEALREILTADGVYCRMVAVDYASHSPHMAALRPHLRRELDGGAPRTEHRAPRTEAIEMMSTVHARTIAPAELTTGYWLDNLCEPVRFADAVSSLYDSGVTHIVEIGPHPVLAPAMEQLAADRADPPAVLASIHRDTDPRLEFERARARAFISGLAPFADLTAAPRVATPPYPFQRDCHPLPAPRVRPRPDSSGLRVALEPSPSDPGTWTGRLDGLAEAMSWLNDHRVAGTVLAPAALMTTSALAAARTRYRAPAAVLRELRFLEPLVLSDPPGPVAVTLREDLDNALCFEFASTAPGTDRWTVHARGRVEPLPTASRNHPEFPAHLLDGTSVAIEDFYRDCARRGLHYGPHFRVVEELRVHGEAESRTVLAKVVLGRRCRALTRPGEWHPALLDGALQTALALLGADTRTHLPVAVGELRPHSTGDHHIDVVWAAARRGPAGIDIDLFDTRHRPLASIGALSLHPVEAAARPDRAPGRMFHLAYEPQPRPERRTPRSFLLTGHPAAHPDLPAALRAEAPSTRWSDDGDGDGDVVVFLAPSASSGLGTQRRALTDLTDLVRRRTAAGARPGRLVVVTTGAQAATPDASPDPGAALFWGLVRVLRREHPELRAQLIDLHPETGHDVVADCVAELLACGEDDQVILHRGRRFAGRLRQGAPDSTGLPPAGTGAQPFELRATPATLWDGLAFRPLPPREPGAGEVLIEVEAAALNYMDVMKVAGAYPDTSAGSDRLGAECAGIVRAVGPGVRDRVVGDRVVGCVFGALASHVLVRADHTALVPARMPAHEAAAVPIVTTTAWYALVRRAAMTADDTVLIHSAAGGLGAAALGVARAVGARVIATAGTEQRRAHLRAQGVEHVFDSRSSAWPDQVRAATGGRGVDVVLNCLAGAGIDHGLDVLAEDGRFVEVGKKDIHAGRRIELRAFTKGISLAAVDLAGLITRRPGRFADLLRETWREVVAGRLPVPPVATRDFAAAGRALRELGEGTHIGKLVLTRLETVTHIVADPLPGGRLRADGAYLITGGRGALGRSLAEHLLSLGAGAVALIGRGEPDSASEHGRERLRHYRADVADRAALARALDAIRTDLPPLRGVYHLAGVLDDATIATTTPDRVERVLRPKIDGARHLHELTANDPLDLFVLFSSAAALVGNPGQGAYAAANAYLDALATARRHAGLPGLSVQWGPFEDIGLAAAEDSRGARLAARGLLGFGAGEAWEALRLLTVRSAPVVGYFGFNRRQWFDAYPDCAAQPSWQTLTGDTEPEPATGADGFQQALDRATEAERRRLIRDKVAEIAAKVLRVPRDRLDAATPLKALGMDSLMSLEMRNRLEHAFAVPLSPTVLWTYGTTEALSGAIGERLSAPARPATELRTAVPQETR